MKLIYNKKKILSFYNIKFYDWSFSKIMKRMNTEGGYLVAPAASALVDIKANKIYYNSLKNSKCAIFDSGFFCLLLRLFRICNPKKFSGYLFIKNFLSYKIAKKKKILLVNASNKQAELNQKLMLNKKFEKIFCYLAPYYKNIKIYDHKLFNYINKCKPHYILINIGGLKQEPLASWIIGKAKFKCIIFCTGGAIDFITGLQAPINTFIDKIYLGWLLRIIFSPSVFFIRLFKSLFLIKYFIKQK
jgi:UDP-N-acetyl-D-mannosaminuronic acid transferase (WecB/TagA/CpsF family)